MSILFLDICNEIRFRDVDDDSNRTVGCGTHIFRLASTTLFCLLSCKHNFPLSNPELTEGIEDYELQFLKMMKIVVVEI